MVQCCRVFLKGCMMIRHGGVAGVAGLGEQAEVGEAQYPDQFSVFHPCMHGTFLPVTGL